MIVNDVVTGIIAIVIGYLLGSIPSAYIAARLVMGKDIRRLGGGNVGGLNTYREVGAWSALAVGIVEGITELGQHLAEGVSRYNLKAKQDLTIEDGGVEMGIGQVNDGKELAVERLSESPQGSGLTDADIAGDQGG